MSGEAPEKIGLLEVVSIGIGGMVGGGIFAVLGLAMDVAGHAVAVAFALSAINATLFGSSRLAMAMGRVHVLPRIFSLRERTRRVPWVALIAVTGATLAFILFSDLAVISAFASATFLLIFFAINASAARLHARIGLHPSIPIFGTFLCGATFLVVLWHTWQTSPRDFMWIMGIYAAAAAGELGLVLARGPRARRQSD